MNKFVLTGPRKGQTIVLGGVEFHNGVGVVQSSSKDDIQAIAYHLGTYYGAFHESVAEEAEALYQATQAALSGKSPTPAPIVAAAAESLIPAQPVVKAQDLTPRSPPEPVKQPEVDPLAPALTIADALQTLDPDKDEHWTSRGLPSVDVITGLLNKIVTRDEIDAAAEGFTRAAAKAAKAA